MTCFTTWLYNIAYFHNASLSCKQKILIDLNDGSAMQTPKSLGPNPGEYINARAKEM